MTVVSLFLAVCTWAAVMLAQWLFNSLLAAWLIGLAVVFLAIVFSISRPQVLQRQG
jgi:cytochrome c biogenesis protein CcdA